MRRSKYIYTKVERLIENPVTGEQKWVVWLERRQVERTSNSNLVYFAGLGGGFFVKLEKIEDGFAYLARLKTLDNPQRYRMSEDEWNRLQSKAR